MIDSIALHFRADIVYQHLIYGSGFGVVLKKKAYHWTQSWDTCKLSTSTLCFIKVCFNVILAPVH